MKQAIRRLRAPELIDLRKKLLARIGPQVSNLVAGAPDVRAAATVLAALGEVNIELPIDTAALADVADRASLPDIRLLLEAAYGVTPQLAIQLANKLGGSPTLLKRLEHERPWVRRAQLATDQEGRVTAQAEYAYVADSAQTDVHDEVVGLASYLAAFAPETEVAVCRAVDAAGNTAGFRDVPLADKRIPRGNLPSPDLAVSLWG